MTRRLRPADSSRYSLEQAMDWLSDGVILIDVRGKVMYANRAFEAILASRDGIGVRRGTVEFLSGVARERFQLALAMVRGLHEKKLRTGGSDFPVPRPSGAPGYLVSVRPLTALDLERPRDSAAAGMVFVRDPMVVSAANLQLLREILGLTEAEAGLARALQGGVTLSQYARSRSVSLNTVYTHLRRLKDKAGCHRMPGLIRKLNDLQVPLQAG